MTHQATGAFDVKMEPQPADVAAAGEVIGRMLLDKKYHGSLDATGKGQMLAVRTAIQGSAGYVAMNWSQASWMDAAAALCCSTAAPMNRGTARPGIECGAGFGHQANSSASTGSMEIIITNGKHDTVLSTVCRGEVAPSSRSSSESMKGKR